MSGSEHTVIENVNHVMLVLPEVRTTTPTITTEIDMNIGRAGLIAFAIGAAGITLTTSNKITISLTESNDNSSYTAVANTTNVDCVFYRLGDLTTVAAASIALVDNAQASDIYFAEYKGSMRYVRPVFTFGGTHSTGTPIASWGEQTGLRQYPTTFVAVGDNS